MDAFPMIVRCAQQQSAGDGVTALEGDDYRAVTSRERAPAATPEILPLGDQGLEGHGPFDLTPAELQRTGATPDARVGT